MSADGGRADVADIGSPYADLDPSTDRYARRFSGPTGEWLLARQTDGLRGLVGPEGPYLVLDVGGGHGQVARPLLADGHDVTVLASHDGALGQVETMGHPNLTLKTGALTALPFADRSFDVVTAFRLMAHIGDWNALLAELCRVSRRMVVIDFPLPGGFNALEPLLFGLKKRAEGDTRSYDTMALSEVEAALDGHGFGVTDRVGQFVLPMVVHRKLGRPSLSGRLERACASIGLDRRIGTPVILRADRRA